MILSRTFGTAQWNFDAVSTPKAGTNKFAHTSHDDHLMTTRHELYDDDDDDDADDDDDNTDDVDKPENLLISVPKVSWQIRKSAAE